MSITYTTGIPEPTHNPSVDAPNMQTNTNSIDTWNAVDHYSFSSANAGHHKQVTLSANNVAGAQTGFASTIYSDAGTAGASASQLFYRNSSLITPLSAIKAFALINTTGLSIVNGINISGVTRPGTGIYEVTLSTALPSASYAVIATPVVVSGGGYPNITISYLVFSTTVFRLYTQDTSGNVGINVTGLSVIVMQV